MKTAAQELEIENKVHYDSEIETLKLNQSVYLEFMLMNNAGSNYINLVGVFVAQAINEKIERESSQFPADKSPLNLPSEEEITKSMLRKKTNYMNGDEKYSTKKMAYKAGWNDCKKYFIDYIEKQGK